MKAKPYMAIPGIAVALLPKLACPACAPAYAAVMSAVGLGFLTTGPYLLPTVIAGLVLAIGVLGLRASERRGYGPMALGSVAAIAIVLGKFALEQPGIFYTGIVVLVAASVWNAWPRRTSGDAPCPACRSGRATDSVEGVQ